MKAKNKTVIITTVVLIIAAAFIILKSLSSKKADINVVEIRPVSGDIRLTVSTTGTVLPKNRLELMPSVAGRIDKIFVKEGDRVRAGHILALMSSTDRAALIDAARLQGPGALKYWRDAYKQIPIVAPINGTVIVRSVEPGQTVVTSDDIIVISDRLIVKAQVDETDIGRVIKGQSAYITLDSHPDIPVKGRVTHISYESTTVNNVTIYYVVITPDKVPIQFRSGMSASIEIIEKEKNNVLLIPHEAIIPDGNQNYVLIKKSGRMQSEKRAVEVGLESDENVEVTSGIGKNDVLLFFTRKIVPGKSGSSKNPFLPERPGRRRK